MKIPAHPVDSPWSYCGTGSQEFPPRRIILLSLTPEDGPDSEHVPNDRFLDHKFIIVARLRPAQARATYPDTSLLTGSATDELREVARDLSAVHVLVQGRATPEQLHHLRRQLGIPVSLY
jgi:hypothetical protein